MSDETIQLPNIPAAESIPPALAAPKRARKPVAPVATAAAPALVQAPAAPVAAAPAPITPEPQPAAETPPAAETAEPQQETVPVATTAETVQNVNETAATQAKAMFADAKDRTEAAVAKGQMFWSEMAEFNKGNVEALVESGRVAARGFEQLGREAAEEARRSFEAAQAAVKTLSQVKSPTEFVRLQGEFTRTAFDHAVAQTSRSTESMLKLVGEIAQPLSNRMALAADKMKAAA